MVLTFTPEPTLSRIVTRRWKGEDGLKPAYLIWFNTKNNSCFCQVFKIWKPWEDSSRAEVWWRGGKAPDRWRHCPLQSTTVSAQTQHHGPHRKFSFWRHMVLTFFYFLFSPCSVKDCNWTITNVPLCSFTGTPTNTGKKMTACVLHVVKLGCWHSLLPKIALFFHVFLLLLHHILLVLMSPPLFVCQSNVQDQCRDWKSLLLSVE